MSVFSFFFNFAFCFSFTFDYVWPVGIDPINFSWCKKLQLMLPLSALYLGGNVFCCILSLMDTLYYCKKIVIIFIISIVESILADHRIEADGKRGWSRERSDMASGRQHIVLSLFNWNRTACTDQLKQMNIFCLLEISLALKFLCCHEIELIFERYGYFSRS